MAGRRRFDDHQVRKTRYVSTMLRHDEPVWTVVFKSYSPWELPEIEDEQFKSKSHTYQTVADEEVTICEELQSTEDFAVVFVADTIKEAKGVFFDHQNFFKSSLM